MSGDVLAVSGVEKVVNEAQSNDVIPRVVTPYIGSSWKSGGARPEWCGLGGALIRLKRIYNF
jgi:hypothetical protein